MRSSAVAKTLRFYGRFLPSFTAIGYGIRRLTWGPVAADFTDRTWLVTGATGGIGRAIALEAARRGARVLAVGRREEALARLACDANGRIERLRFDLSLVARNRELAAAAPAIDVLVNNVGMLAHEHRVTAEGWGEMYATNLLGHYALTSELIARGRLSGGLIINMASGGLYNAPLNLSGLDARPPAFNGLAAYASHKRAQITLSDRWTGMSGVTAYTMHPGWVRTAGVRDALPRMDRMIGPILRSPRQGADTALWLAATRPSPVAGALWFDRAPRRAHVYAATRQAFAGPEDLIARLEADMRGGQFA